MKILFIQAYQAYIKIKKCKQFLPINRIIHFKQQNGKYAKKGGYRVFSLT